MRSFYKITFTLISLFTILSIFFQLSLPKNIKDIRAIEIYDKENNSIKYLSNNKNISWAPLETFNDFTLNAFLSVEDKNYYSHQGIEPYRILKSVYSNIINKDVVMGASTITQQYSRATYLNNDESYVRKLKEIYYTFKLESKYTKDEIFEGYLNTLYFGHNIYGIKNAAKFFFNKKINEIGIKESCMLVSIVNGPALYSPFVDLEASLGKTNECLGKMKDENYINQKEYKALLVRDINLADNDYMINKNSSLEFFVDMTLNEHTKNVQNKYYINYKTDIYTDYNKDINDLINNKNDNNFGDLNNSVIVTNKEGYYESFTGGSDYYKSSYNIATGANRHIGSTIKPLLYYVALENGFEPSSMFKSEKSVFYYNNRNYSPTNFKNIYENEKISLAYALITSDNMFAVKTLFYLGATPLLNILENFNIPINNSEPSLALGATQISLLNLNKIYTAFMRQGVSKENKFIRKVRINNKENMITDSTKSTRVLDEKTSFIISDILRNTFNVNLNSALSVTGGSISDEMNHVYASKSGSTDYDSYMIGYNRDYTVSVWVGHNENILLTDNENRISKNIFLEITNGLKNDSWFEVPPGVKKSSILCVENKDIYMDTYVYDSRPYF